MSHIDAIYRHGVFEPLGPVDFEEEQRVHLTVEPAAKNSLTAWLEQVRTRQAAIIRRQGFLPDSAPDIAEDRRR